MKSKFLVGLLVFMGLLFSCNQEIKQKELSTIKKVFFIEKKEMNSSSEILENILIDGVTYQVFIQENNIDKLKFEHIFKQRLEEFSFYLNASGLGGDTKPTPQEIRDAMLEECERGYCCGLDEACKAAVKVAYFVVILK